MVIVVAAARNLRRWAAASALAGVALAAAAPANGGAPEQPLELIDAVRTALAHNPAIRLEEQAVAERDGALRAAGGPFEWQLWANLSQSADTAALTSLERDTSGLMNVKSLTTYSTIYEVGTTRRLRTGTLLQPSLRFARVDEHANPKVSGASFLSGRATVAFSLVQPLMRGWGAQEAVAAEEATRRELQASRARMRHAVAEEVHRVTAAYWQYFAATQTAAVLDRVEQQARAMLADQRILVEAKQRPAADLNQLAASLEDAGAQRVEALRQRVRQRQQLGLAMGLPHPEIPQIGPPSTEPVQLGAGAAALQPDEGQLQRLIARALERRADREAALHALAAARLRAEAAAEGVRPRLDLQVDVGYTGLTETPGPRTFVAPLFENVAGPKLFAGLGLELPVGLDARRGELAQRLAQVRGAEIQLAELERTIAAEVTTALEDVRLCAAALVGEDRAVVAYRTALEGEVLKQRAGLSTAFEVVLSHNRLSATQVAAIAARARLAASIVGLRLATGTLLDWQGGDSFEVGLDQVAALPAWE